MDLQLEVVLLSSIKRKKPWPRFCWLGLEKESVFLLDDNRISEINMTSGRTKKKTPKLQPLLHGVVTMAGSQNGVWLAGLLVSGEVFMWSRDRDCLKTVATVPDLAHMVSAAREASVRLSLLVSDDGHRVLLIALTGQVFLWECAELRDLMGSRDGVVRGRWVQILSPKTTGLPSPQDKDAHQHSIFVQGGAVGDCCLSAFVFVSGEELSVTLLKIRWEEGEQCKHSSVGYSVHWVTRTYPLTRLSPPCRPVKSRGALVPAFSPDGLLLAVVLNQRDPRATQVLFISTQNFVSVPSWLGGCGSKNLSVPSKYVRSYWVGNVSWMPGGLYLACVLKRGSLLVLARLGGLLSLSTSGCSVEFGPAHFLPLHPLVTYRPPVPSPQDASLSSSGTSARDALRQRYSVTWHPRLPYLIVSDGYTATVLRAPTRLSPTAVLSALLLDAADGLERVGRELVGSQPQVKARLESMSTLKMTVSLQDLKPKDTPSSSLPHFLLDDGNACDLSELYKTTRCGDEDESDGENGQFPGPRAEDGGRLEFASMFDTLHAQPAPYPDQSDDGEDGESGDPPLLGDLERVHRSLLTAWALGVSLGGAVEQRGRLLRCAVRCVLRYAALLRLAPSPVSRGGEKGDDPWPSRVLRLLRSLLSLLPWDAPRAEGSSCLAIAVELTGRIVRLLLTPPPALSSHNLCTAVLVLQLASRSLDHTYCLLQRADHRGEHAHPAPSRDEFCVPLLQEREADATHGASQGTLCTVQQPSSRLQRVWRGLYRITLRYQEDLLAQKGHAWQEAELGRVSHVLSEVQRVLQRTGDWLSSGPMLHSVAGELLFLSGSYAESAQVWASELRAERERAGPRTLFLETRYCLALLYGQLFQYRLREAQALCDHLTRQLVRRATPDVQYETRGPDQPPLAWLPAEVDQEAARSVVQSLGRFMASYFTNQPLTILPPHSVGVLPPLHLPSTPAQRLVPLCQSSVSGAVRKQQLSEVWTVGYALDLLLLGGLLPEAVWLAHRLGDWKTAASLGLAYTRYCRDHFDFTGLKWRELHLPDDLRPARIFQDQLEALLGRDAQGGSDDRPYKCFTDAMEEEDVELLEASVQEILKASVMAEVDIVSQPLRLLLDSAKDLASGLSALVPCGVYLPAPPLYCPQPAVDTQDSLGDLGLISEVLSRQRVSGVLQRALLLLRAGHSSRPAAQWYISRLRRCRLRLLKIRKNGPHPLNAFPEGLMKFITPSGFFDPELQGGGQTDAVVTQAITCFRELCGLCWMLHVRDQLSVSCRKYQAARNHGRETQGNLGDVVSTCSDALLWACRLLPFSRFLNAEEILQDVVLSLVSELPPVPLVAEVLVLAFPEEEESVRVPLREKYSSLLQRLQQCTIRVSEPDGEETLMVHLHERLRWRSRDRRRLAKHLAPLEQQLWERVEEKAEEGAVGTPDRFSLGASLSRSTLTECGLPLVFSDGDTAGDVSEHGAQPAHSSETAALDRTGTSKAGGGGCERTRAGEDGRREPGNHEPQAGPVLPSVGTWEFELEDEEYPRFLELFLSYALERDGVEAEDSDTPLLRAFAPQLRERELHSLAFDVVSAVKRRRREGRPAPGGGREGPLMFRAGRSYQLVRDQSDQRSSPVQPPSFRCGPQAPQSRTPSTVHTFPGVRTGKPQGLFGLRQRTGHVVEAPVQGAQLGIPANPSQSFSQWTSQADSWPFKILPASDAPGLQADVDPDLEVQFQGLGRLLEWMVRWSDRRPLLGRHTRKREGPVAGPAGSVFIRTKTSAPAVLTALRLMEHRYTAALLASDQHCAQFPAPGLQPDSGGRRLERESSMDTGYPGSAGTPVTPADLEQEACPRRGSVTEEPEGERAALHLSDQSGLTSDLTEVEDAKGPMPDEESEGESSADEPWGAPVSLSDPSISVQITAFSRSPGTSLDKPLTLADLEFQGRPSVREEKGSRAEEAACRTLPSLLSNASAETAIIKPAAVDSAPGPKSPAQPNPHSLTTAGLKPGPQVPGLPTGSALQPGETLDPVRQLMQDELFRLVQLQQINFMSLMQVVGTSFANLMPLPQAPPNLLQTGQPPPLPGQESSDLVFTAAGPRAEPRGEWPADQQQTRRDLQPRGEWPADQQQTRRDLQPRGEWPADQQQTHRDLQPRGEWPADQQQTRRDLQPRGEWPADQQQTRRDLQPRGEWPADQQQTRRDLHPRGEWPADQQQTRRDLQPRGEWPYEQLPIPKNPPELRNMNGGQGTPELSVDPEWLHGFIPSSQGLLTTAAAGLGLPLLLPPSGRSRNSPNLGGPESTVAPVSGLKLLQLHPPQLPSPAVPPRAREAWGPQVEAPSSRRGRPPPPPPHANTDRYDLPLLRETEERRARWAERVSSRPPEHPLLDQQGRASQAPPKDAEGGPLRLPLFPTSHGLPLLRFHPDARRPIAFPHVPHTAPLALLTCDLRAPGVQLLQRDPQPLGKVPPTSWPTPRLIPPEELTGRGAPVPRLLTVEAPSSAAETTAQSTKRQRRREERRREGKRAGVTFRPEDSIIPASPEPEELAPSGAAVQEDFVFPLSSFDSAFSSRGGLLSQAWSTAAELHAFASTQKRAPEIQDASTNTEPAVPRSLADKAVSALPPASSRGTGDRLTEVAALPPNIFLNLRFPEEPPAQDRDPSGRTEDAGGAERRFISVIDLEDVALLRDLPPCQTPPLRDGSPSVPSSAQLHLMAASVVNSASTELPAADAVSGPCATTSPPAVRLVSESRGDALTEGTGRGVGDASRSQVSARLLEMDTQLVTLQSIADHMDREFANTRMLVRTIETLGPEAPEPSVEDEPRPSCSVGVAVTGAVSRVCRPKVLSDLWEENEEEESVEFIAPAPSAITPPSLRGRSSFSPPLAALKNPSVRLNSSSIDFGTQADTSGKWAEDSLTLSGLSDVADILGELVRDGGVPSSALGLSSAQAARLSGLGEQRSVRDGEEKEEERREVRAWMRRKQRERLSEYRRQREERREQERKPFRATASLNPTSRDLTINKKSKEEKDRTILLKHHTQRTRDACSLMAELIAAPLSLPIVAAAPLAQSSRRGNTRTRPRSQSLARWGRSPKSQTRPARSQSSPGRTIEGQGRSASGAHATPGSRLGTHRPARALPGDRLSQVTRRGMLADSRKGAGRKRFAQGQRQKPERSSGGWNEAGNEEAWEEVREVVSPWNPPQEIRRILGLENKGRQKGRPEEVKEAAVTGGSRELDWLEALSESTGSILSKLDWAAIENMVAGEEDV